MVLYHEITIVCINYKKLFSNNQVKDSSVSLVVQLFSSAFTLT